MQIRKVNVGNAPSAADVVFENLRRAVISGALKDGHPLRQEEIARHFNTSRIPVREALTRLEQHGLAQVRRYHGYTVAQMSSAQIEEICRFRALVEGEVVASAVPRTSDANLALARKSCEAFAKERDPVLWGERNDLVAVLVGNLAQERKQRGLAAAGIALHELVAVLAGQHGKCRDPPSSSSEPTQRYGRPPNLAGPAARKPRT